MAKKNKKTKKQKKGTLPSKINILGKVFNTPPTLRNLKFKGRDIEAELKLLVYSIQKHTKTRKTLKEILNILYKVRDNYAFKGIKPDRDTFDWKVFIGLKIDDGFYPRGEILDKITSANLLEDVKLFRFQCFDCRMRKTIGYNFTMVNSENELNLLWEARERYLKEIDDGSLIFSVYFFYERYTNLSLVDFSRLQIDSGNVEEFEKILRMVIKDNDYARY